MDRATRRAARAPRRDPRPRAGGAARAPRLRVGAHERVPVAPPRRRRAASPTRIERFRDCELRGRGGRRASSASCSRSSSGCARSSSSWRSAASASAAARPPTTRRRSRSASASRRSSGSRATSREGNFEPISPEELRELLGEDARALAGPAARPRARRCARAGYLRGGDPRAHAARDPAHRRAGAGAGLRRAAPGPPGRARDRRARRRAAAPRRDAPLRVRRSARPRRRAHAAQRGEARRAGGAGPAAGARRSAARRGLRGARARLAPRVTTTVLLLDMSWSMSWAGRFPAAKRVALAIDHLVRTRFPRDHFFVVGFSTRARELLAARAARGELGHGRSLHQPAGGADDRRAADRASTRPRARRCW